MAIPTFDIYIYIYFVMKYFILQLSRAGAIFKYFQFHFLFPHLSFKTESSIHDTIFNAPRLFFFFSLFAFWWYYGNFVSMLDMLARCVVQPVILINVEWLKSIVFENYGYSNYGMHYVFSDALSNELKREF